ncbi:Metallothionein expression activator [Mortierella sp. AD094]|nr:Metallothionein expression activator [Mortierella sp. AD094]
MDPIPSDESPSVQDNPPSPQQGTSPTPTDIEAVAAVTSQAFSVNFSQSTADEIRALTDALTTPLQEIVNKAQTDSPAGPETAALGAAVAATVAAATAGLTEHVGEETVPGQESEDQQGQQLQQHQERTDEETMDSSTEQITETVELAKSSSSELDVDSVYNQVLSLTSQSQKPAVKRSAEEAFEQNQAARALQLIALSLSNPSAATNALAAPSSPSATPESGESTTLPESTSDTTHTNHVSDDALKGHDTGASVSDTLMSISRAINFPAQSTSANNIEADTEAFTRAVISATQNEANKGNNNVIPPSDGQGSSGLDHAALQNLSLHQHNYTSESGTSSSDQAAAVAVTSAPASAPSSSSQGFTFEIDKATGKTQIKWTSNPRDETNNELQDADTKAIQQALATIMANSGITGLSDLAGPNAALLAPPLGPFPVQGSEFGTAQDPVKAEPNSIPRKRRRANPSTSKSANQNTAASIPEGAPSFPCEYPGCDKVFARLYNLKSHSRTHTDERPFVCSSCQLAFARNHDLKRHIDL